jgi:hypothetical protein
VDHGAVFAGYVGIGMAIVIAIAFELIIAVQTLVFVAAPLGGVLIGAYANQRSERWRPMKRVFANAAWAALVTGLSLALIYGALRLLFVFADTGYRIEAQGGQIQCQAGPECTYYRYVAEGHGEELAAVGVTDGPSFGAYIASDVVTSGAFIVALTLAGALLAAAWRATRTPPAGIALAGAPAQGR